MEQPSNTITVWLTGYPGTGKREIAKEANLFTLDPNKSFISPNEGIRSENHFNRLAEIARLMNMAGIPIISPHFCPSREIRQGVKGIIGEGSFRQIYLEADPENLSNPMWDLAESGEVAIEAEFDPPANPDLKVDADHPADAKESVFAYLDAL